MPDRIEQGTETTEIRQVVARAICRAGSGGSAPLEARNWERYRDLYERDADAALAVIYPSGTRNTDG